MNILISLEKQYFDQIKEGTKRYEYRRRFVKVPCTAYLYITAPYMQIMGYMDLANPIVDTPDALGDFAELQVRGIGDDIREYMRGLEEGFAAPIKALYEIEPISFELLRAKFQDLVAPQGYVILDKKPELLALLQKSKVIRKWNL